MSSKELEAMASGVLGVKDLLEQGVCYVPQVYIRPAHQRPSSSPFSSQSGIPVIDFSHFILPQCRAATVDALRRASEEWGMFQLINHGISHSVMRKMVQAVHDFFHLPQQERDLHRGEGNFRYYTSFNPEKEEVRNWSDSLFLKCTPQLDHDLPQNPTSFREAAKDYMECTGVLAQQLLTAFSEALGLPSGFLEKHIGIGRVGKRFNYYPPCPEPDLTIGLGGHRDIGLFTILQQDDDIVGLHMNHQQQWIPVQPMPNAFVIFVADQLQILSNGRFKSIKHRAVVNSKKTRVSIANFYDPSEDTIVAPIRELVDEKHKLQYREVRYGDYLNTFLGKALDANLIDSFRIPTSNSSPV